MQQLTRLNPQQLLHATKNYRPEVGEKTLNREGMKFLVGLNMSFLDSKARRKSRSVSVTTSNTPQHSLNPTPTTPTSRGAVSPSSFKTSSPLPAPFITTTSPGGFSFKEDEQEEDNNAPENLLLDPALMLPFSLPTSTDMLLSYGAGLGGTNREREKKYQPSVPPEYLERLNFSQSQGRNGGGSNFSGWQEDDD